MKKVYSPVYDIPVEELLEEINTRYPINLKYNAGLVKQVHDRYPLLKKSEIAVIMIGAFQSWRDLLVLGKTLNVGNLFRRCKLLFFARREKKVIVSGLKAKLFTAVKLR